MKVLFIGGTGTISSACARLCVEQGFELWVLLRGTRDGRLPEGVHVLHGDLRQDTDQARCLLRHHTWDCVVDWVAYDEEDVLRDVDLFAGRTSQYVFISSTAAYRKPLASAAVDESSAIGNPLWAYADNKARAEQVLFERRRQSGFPVLVVRPGHTYADFALPTGIAGLGFRVVERMQDGKAVLVHGDGLGLWTLAHAEDFARGFVPLLGLEAATGQAIQIMSDELLTWIQIYSTIGAAVGRSVSFAYAPSSLIAAYDAQLGATLLGDKAHTYLFDTRRLKALVPDFRSHIPFAEGAQRCARWYRDFGNASPRGNGEQEALVDRIVRHVQTETLHATHEEAASVLRE